MLQIFVQSQSFDGNKIINVNRYRTIKDIKLQIQSKTGITADKQRISLKTGYVGKILKDECSIEDYNIQNGDTLSLKVYLGAQPNVHQEQSNKWKKKKKNPKRSRSKSLTYNKNKKKGRNSQCRTPEAQPHASQKSPISIYARSSLPQHRINIETNHTLFKNLGAQTPSKSPNSMKNPILLQPNVSNKRKKKKKTTKQSRSKSPTNHKNKKKAEKSPILAACPRVSIWQYHINIEINDTSRKLACVCHGTNSINAIREWIHNQTGISIQDQSLFAWSDALNTWFILENDKTLKYYNIANNTTLKLQVELRPMNICVETPYDDCWILSVNGLDTIHTLKTQIHSKYGIPISRQCLCLNGQHLITGDRTLHSYQISSDTAIQLVSLTYYECKTKHDLITQQYRAKLSNLSNELLTQNEQSLKEIFLKIEDEVNNATSVSALDEMTPTLYADLASTTNTVSASFDALRTQTRVAKEGLEAKVNCYLKEETQFIETSEREIEDQLAEVNKSIESLQQKENELMQLKLAKESFLNIYCKGYKELYQPICDQSIAAVDEEVSKVDAMIQSVYGEIARIDAQCKLNRMIDHQRKEFEKQYKKWDNDDLMAWIKLIENAHFDSKRFDKSMNNLDEMKIDGHQLHELNNQLFLEHVLGMEQQEQYILRKHINRIVSNQQESAAENNICCICATNVINTVTIPCRHSYLCSECARRCSHQMRKCSICRTKIREIIQIFVSGFSK